MTLIHERVEAARRGENNHVIARLASGWAVIGDVQPLPGYCLLLPDPVAPSLNDLDEDARTSFLLDMSRIGDALLDVLAANPALSGNLGAVQRINYEILGNTEPALHAHIIPRFAGEPSERRCGPATHYDWSAARRSEPRGADALLIKSIREALGVRQ